MPDLLSDDDRRLLAKGPDREITEITAKNRAAVEDLLIAMRRFTEAGSPGLPGSAIGAIGTLDLLLDRKLGEAI